MSQNFLPVLRWNVEIKQKYIRDRSVIVRVRPANEPDCLFSVANHQHIGKYVVNGDRILNEIYIRGIVLDENDQMPARAISGEW